MHIGITGVGSMVGYHLAEELLSKNIGVIGVDNKKNQSVNDLKKYKNFRFYSVDILEFEELKKRFNKVEIIYHLAGISSERLVKENIPKAVEVNVMGTINCLQIAKYLNAKLIYASSAAVYPTPEHRGGVYPHPENLPKESEASLCGKLYGTTKFMGEEFCRLYAKNFNLIFTALRFSRIYGPRMGRNPIYDMTVAFSKEQPIKLYESLDCNYDFVYVKDVVNALIMAQDKNWDNQEVNIGTGEGVSLKDVYDVFREITNKKLKIEILNDKKNQDILNIKKAKSLGWKSTYSLKDGIKQTLEYFEPKI